MTRLLPALTVPLLALSLAGCHPQRAAKFGAVLPLSGPAQTYAESIQRGLEVGLDEARHDEDPGWEIDLTVVDSEGSPERAAQLLGELYDQGVMGVIGGVTSAEALAMVEVADQRDRVLLSPSASSPELSGMSRNFYRIFPSDFVEGTKMGNFAAQKLKIKNIVILATESPYGRGIQGVFRDEFQRNGGQVLEIIEFPPGTSDLSGLVERVLTLEPQAVYLAAFWEEITEMVRALREKRFEGRILTTAAFATPQAIARAGEDAEDVFFTQTVFDVESDSEPTRSFVDSYRRRYEEDPDLYAAHGYDAMTVMVQALRKGKKGMSPSDFWKGLVSLRAFPGVTGSLQFDEKGDVQKYPRVYVIKNGVPENYEAYIQKLKDAFRERLRELEERRRRLQQRP